MIVAYQDSNVAENIVCCQAKVIYLLGEKALEIALKYLKQLDLPLYYCLQMLLITKTV